MCLFHAGVWGETETLWARVGGPSAELCIENEAGAAEGTAGATGPAVAGVSAAAGEEEIARGLLPTAAGTGGIGEEMCLFWEGADSARSSSGRDKVGGETS